MELATNFEMDERCKTSHFILSNINSIFLKRHKIDMTVESFKKIVKRSKPAFIALTGGRGHERHTKVYDINDFKKYKSEEQII